MNIVIVGGGTSGWTTALILAHEHPNHTFTVIESSKFGIIGVGESTTGYFTNLFDGRYGLSLKDFMLKTNATPKYAIRHINWAPDVTDYYTAPIDGSYTSGLDQDLFFYWGINNLSRKDLGKISRLGNFIDKKFTLFHKTDQDFIDYNFALHIDGMKTSEYLKNHCLQCKNVKLIDTEVTNVNIDDKGFIKSLNLSNQTDIGADFFIDCSGFKKILINELKENNWISYKDHLPVNTAIPFFTQYNEHECPELYTTAWAQNNGWVWRGPLAHRRGNGYVFSDDFISIDDAIKEVETAYGHSIDPIKVVKFDAGRLKQSWIKNCFANGLSSQFLEPMEATAIHHTVVQTQIFSKQFLKNTIEDTCNEYSQKIYNETNAKSVDDYMHFLNMHYMGGRTDTEFWKYVTNNSATEYNKTLIESSKSRIPSRYDFPTYYGSGGGPLYSHIMYQIGLINPEIAVNDLSRIHTQDDIEHALLDMQDEWYNTMSYCMTSEEFHHYRFKN